MSRGKRDSGGRGGHCAPALAGRGWGRPNGSSADNSAVQPRSLCEALTYLPSSEKLPLEPTAQATPVGGSLYIDFFLLY